MSVCPGARISPEPVISVSLLGNEAANIHVVFISMTSILGLKYIFFIIFIRLMFYILLLTSYILLHDDFLTIHNVETLSRLSHALTSEVINLTTYIFHLTSYFVYACCFAINIEAKEFRS